MMKKGLMISGLMLLSVALLAACKERPERESVTPESHLVVEENGGGQTPPGNSGTENGDSGSEDGEAGASGAEDGDAGNSGDDDDVPGTSGAEAARLAQEKLAQMTLEEKIAQMFIVTPESLTGFDLVTQAGGTTKAAIDQYPVGGLIYMGQNIVDAQQVKDMLSTTQNYAYERSGIPMFLSVDEEGGTVARVGEKAAAFGIERIGNMCDVGASGDLEEALRVGRTIGNYLKELGFNLDFAPDSDVLTNPENQVVKYRSFGSDPQLVYDMSRAVLTGLWENQIMGVLKHFPGHGATTGDTHEGYAYTDKTLEQLMENEMVPFVRGIEDGISLVMVGHISCPQVTGDETPASLSETMVTEILRNQLGYQGMVITDALNMGAIQNQYTPAQAAVKAVKAGVDIILMPGDFDMAYEGIVNAVAQGELTEERINESVRRILTAKYEMIQ